MKKQEVIEAVRNVFSKLREESAVTTVAFGVSTGSDDTVAGAVSGESRTPEFEIAGWQFFTKTELWEDEPSGDGDASLRAPDGNYIGVVWTSTGQSKYQFDFSASGHTMIYVDILQPVSSWQELRLQFEPLLAMINLEYAEHVGA